MAAFILSSDSSWATIAFVSGTCAASSDSNNVTTSAINTTGANFMIIGIGHAVSTAVTTPTDSVGGNTWTALTGQDAPGNNGMVFYYAANPNTGASQTFTESPNNNFPSICVFAFSGVTTTSPFDVQNGSNTASNVTTKQPGSVTPSQNNEVIVSAVSFGNATMSVDSGFTIPGSGQINGISGHSYGTAMGYLIQTSASAVNPTWTVSVGSAQPLATVIATFKAPASASSTQVNFINGVKVLNGTTVY